MTIIYVSLAAIALLNLVITSEYRAHTYDPTLRFIRTNSGLHTCDQPEARYNFDLRYRMNRQDLVLLADHRLPGNYERVTEHRDTYNNVEGLAIVLRRLTYPSRWVDFIPIGRIMPSTSGTGGHLGILIGFNPSRFQGQLQKIYKC